MTVGTLVLTVFCTLLLVIATFTQITFSHFCLPIKNLLLGLPCSPQDYTTVYKYIPQIPVVFFIIALLGRKFGIFSICLYIILGMFLPVFALGGGVKYIFENGFGYILAFIPAAFFTGTLLKIKRDFLRILLMAVLGVLTIHILPPFFRCFQHVLSPFYSAYHRPGEVWKLEDSVYDLVKLCAGVLTENPLFFAINSYTTGLAPSVLGYLLHLLVAEKYGGTGSWDDRRVMPPGRSKWQRP